MTKKQMKFIHKVLIKELKAMKALRERNRNRYKDLNELYMKSYKEYEKKNDVYIEKLQNIINEMVFEYS